MTTVLERTPGLEIPVGSLESIIRNSAHVRKLVELFLRCEKRIAFTDSLRRTTDKIFTHDPAMRELFYTLEDTTRVPAQKDAEVETA